MIQPIDHVCKHLLLLWLVMDLVEQPIPLLVRAAIPDLRGELAAGRSRRQTIGTAVHQQQRQRKLGRALQRPQPSVEAREIHAQRDLVVDQRVVALGSCP